jgi:hypothetical protein
MGLKSLGINAEVFLFSSRPSPMEESKNAGQIIIPNFLVT